MTFMGKSLEEDIMTLQLKCKGQSSTGSDLLIPTDLIHSFSMHPFSTP